MLKWDAARGLYRFTLDHPLEAGEYAAIETIETTTSEGQSIYVWTFGVDGDANDARREAEAKQPRKEVKECARKTVLTDVRKLRTASDTFCERLAQNGNQVRNAERLLQHSGAGSIQLLSQGRGHQFSAHKKEERLKLAIGGSARHRCVDVQPERSANRLENANQIAQHGVKERRSIRDIVFPRWWRCT